MTARRRSVAAFALVASAGLLALSVWVAVPTPGLEGAGIYMIISSVGNVLVLRVGFSPHLRVDGGDLVIEQPWGTWMVPREAVVEVPVGGTITVVTARREIDSFALSHSVISTVWWRNRLSHTVVAGVDTWVAAGPPAPRALLGQSVRPRRRHRRRRRTDRLLGDAPGAPRGGRVLTGPLVGGVRRRPGCGIHSR